MQSIKDHTLNTAMRQRWTVYLRRWILDNHLRQWVWDDCEQEILKFELCPHFHPPPPPLSPNDFYKQKRNGHCTIHSAINTSIRSAREVRDHWFLGPLIIFLYFHKTIFVHTLPLLVLAPHLLVLTPPILVFNIIVSPRRKHRGRAAHTGVVPMLSSGRRNVR